MNKTSKEARVVCNGIRYPWLDDEGKESPRRDILVGEIPPARFVPFSVHSSPLDLTTLKEQPEGTVIIDMKNLPFLRANSGRLATMTVITEKATGKVFLRVGIIAPAESSSEVKIETKGILTGIEESRFSIRIIAEGIEELKDYSLVLDLAALAFFKGKDDHRMMGVGFKLKEA